MSKDEFEILLAKLTKKVGYGVAMCILWGEFPKKYIDTITIDQWLEIFNAAPSNTAMKEEALIGMRKLADNLPD